MKKLSVLMLLLFLSCESEILSPTEGKEGEFYADSLTITFRYAEFFGRNQWVADVRYVYELKNYAGDLNYHEIKPAIPGNVSVWVHWDCFCYCRTPRDTLLVMEDRIPLFDMYDYTGLDSVEVYFEMGGEFYNCPKSAAQKHHVTYKGSFSKLDTVMANIEQPYSTRTLYNRVLPCSPGAGSADMVTGWQRCLIIECK